MTNKNNRIKKINNQKLLYAATTATTNPLHLQKNCFCTKPNIITIPPEYEIVCNSCGVSFGYDESYGLENRISNTHLTKTPLDIYQKRQIGCHTKDTEKITKIKLEKSSDLASVADVCSKLHLSNNISEDCWLLYCRLKKLEKFTRAKAVCMSIYQTCMANHIPYDEKTVQDTVCQSFQVKKSAAALDNMVFKADFTQSAEDKRKFYLNSHVAKMQKFYPYIDVSRLQRLSYHNYDVFLRLNERQSDRFSMMDHNILAHRAVQKSLLRCVN